MIFDISIALSWMNAIIAGLLSYFTILRCFRYGCPNPFSWARLAVSLYWCVLYIWIALFGMKLIPAPDTQIFGRVFVRPAFTLTLLIMAISSLQHRNGLFNGQPKKHPDRTS